MASRGYAKGTNFVKRLGINSSDRTPDGVSTDSNFNINFNTGIQLVNSISVISCQFNNVFYNLFNTTAKYNNWITIAGVIISPPSVVGQTVEVPPGYYSAYTLMETLKTIIESFLPGVVVLFTLNPISNIVSVQISAGTYSSVTFRAPVTPLHGVSGFQDYWPMGLLGFTDSIIYMDVLGTATTAINMPSLNNPSVVYITSQALSPSNGFDEKGRNNNVLMEINLTAPFLGLQTYECKVDNLCSIDYGRPRSLSLVDIQLVDHNFDILDLHGTEFNLELRLWLNQL